MLHWVPGTNPIQEEQNRPTHVDYVQRATDNILEIQALRRAGRAYPETTWLRGCETRNIPRTPQSTTPKIKKGIFADSDDEE
jgi:hypothetical protein